MSAWYEMPENTREEKLQKEIAECNYCIRGLKDTMRRMGIKRNDWDNNVMIKAYIERIEKAKQELEILNNEKEA